MFRYIERSPDLPPPPRPHKCCPAVDSCMVLMLCNVDYYHWRTEQKTRQKLEYTASHAKLLYHKHITQRIFDADLLWNARSFIKCAHILGCRRSTQRFHCSTREAVPLRR